MENIANNPHDIVQKLQKQLESREKQMIDMAEMVGELNVKLNDVKYKRNSNYSSGFD